VLHVSSDGHEWRTVLTPRHARILRLLHAARDGLSATELSRHLFGDDDHQVTVRAEVSRLRRVLGPLVSTAPYRISAGIHFTAD
jgi:DNA-binding winged helix-turn-helix (wHTH) protein